MKTKIPVIAAIPILFFCVQNSTLNAAGITFQGNSLKVLEEMPEKSTGLDKIYICYDVKGVDMEYSTSNPSGVKIYRFSNLGGAYAEEVKNLNIESGKVVVKDISGDCGYIVETGTKREYYWIVNYLPHRFSVSSISAAQQQDCDATILDVTGNGDAIHYFTINGQQKVLNREIRVVYDSQEWSETDKRFNRLECVKIFESLNPTLRIMPPAYCATSFHISGDKFLEQWNWLEEAESVVAQPYAVKSMTEAVQEDLTLGEEETPDNETDVDGDNENAEESEETSKPGSNIINSGEDSGLGGSAPAQIEFIAYATEGVIHHEWQMSADPEFNTIDYRFNEQTLNYTFNEEGKFYLRYVGNNADGSCETVSDTYTVSIGASELLCPNAFTPDGDGVNDEWKVSYRSIIEFECWIFDRYGAQLCHFKDPRMGWDGKRGGKYVKPGVYFYVIRAVGSDGKKYKLDGDINIIRHRNPENYSNTVE